MRDDSAAQSLAVDGVSVRYGATTQVLDRVSLTVPPGSVVAIMGVNGAGKTTLARTVTGMLGYHGGRVTAGAVRWGGRNVTGRPAPYMVRAGVSQTLEGRRVFADLTVDQNLGAGGITRRDRRELRTRREWMFELFPRLAERAQQRAGLLSGGEQQMLAFARALMQSPKLIVLDEPSLGLAPKIVTQVADTIRTIRDSGTSVLLIEQNAAMALSVADHAYVISHGRVTRSGPAAELLADPEIRTYYLGLADDGARPEPAAAELGLTGGRAGA
ncbi:MAG: ABC transporter ATP-binding protein [Frankia sp.]|nr:ABC transporter ATP-binding protein [Frankia sp.]